MKTGEIVWWHADDDVRHLVRIVGDITVDPNSVTFMPPSDHDVADWPPPYLGALMIEVEVLEGVRKGERPMAEVSDLRAIE